jgi:hypothetical protein
MTPTTMPMSALMIDVMTLARTVARTCPRDSRWRAIVFDSRALVHSQYQSVTMPNSEMMTLSA